MRPDELEIMPLRVEKLFYDMQNRVMADVVRRIEKTGGITSTADYQIEKMHMFGNSSEYIESEIKRLTGATDSAMWQLYEDAVDKDYTRNKSLYEQVNRTFIPYEDNEVMQGWVKAVVAQTGGEIGNITRSMGFTVSMGGSKKVFTPLSEYYQKHLDAACMDIVTGAFDYNTVMRRVVKEMTASGIRTVDYASGRSSRATVASRRAVMTGVNQLCGKINEGNAKELGTDTFEVTAHANARPSHRSWQGQVYTKKQLVEICGLGSVDGLEGANCRHQHLAFIPGISARTYTDKQLEEMAAKEDMLREWNGKQYKGYEASQEQRHMETVMRKQRADVKLLQQGKADTDDIMAAKSRYLNTLHQYQAFSKKMGLPGQMERVYMDGLGRMVPTKNQYARVVRNKSLSDNAVKSVAKAGKNGIIKIDAEPGSAKYRELKRSEIIQRGISEKKPVFAADDFGRFASKIPPKQGFYDVALHGAPKTVSFYGERIGVETFAEIIKGRQDYDGKSAIRLLSCSTGKGQDCFAQRLSNTLGVPVEAPDDIIWARSDGTYTVGATKHKNTGNMITFKPKRK